MIPKFIDMGTILFIKNMSENAYNVQEHKIKKLQFQFPFAIEYWFIF